MEDPESFWRGLSGKRVIADEVHRIPNPSELLKIAADHFPGVKVLASDAIEDARRGFLADYRKQLEGVLATADDPAARQRFMELWPRRNEAGALRAAARLMAEGGHIESARAKAREIHAGMLPWIAALPRPGAVEPFVDFLKEMLEREF